MAIIDNIQSGKMREKVNERSTCDLFLAIYLINISEFVNEKLYRLISICIRVLRECVNQNLYNTIS